MEKSKIQRLFDEQMHAHVLFKYNDSKDYFHQLLNYIRDGITAGEYVVLVENERNHRLIMNELSTRFTDKEMEYVHYVNSIHFYLSSGSYSPSAIEEYFTKTVQPYVENKISFRSWAHVEWASLNGPSHLIEEFENIVDQAVMQIPFSLICAYDKNRMPDYLKKSLYKTHPYVLLDNELIVSKEYQSRDK
ncbi:MEDS domain-containing protein [Sporosarcina gallistercoris]|nr:MEDS domain-containing protein [Sporosarcina gallistercoris]